MPDYEMMYAKLFNKITDVIEELQSVQRETEEQYIKSGDPELIIIKLDNDAEH